MTEVAKALLSLPAKPNHVVAKHLSFDSDGDRYALGHVDAAEIPLHYSPDTCLDTLRGHRC